MTMNYRTFSIELETDGTYSIYHQNGYIRGGFKTLKLAQVYADRRAHI